MRNKLLGFVAIMLFSFGANTSILAQSNIGGTPIALNTSLKSDIDSKTIEAVSEEWKDIHEAEARNNGSVDPIAKNINTNFSLDNSGTWIIKKNGDRFWRLQITAEDAIGINTIFKDFHLPNGSKLFIYNPEMTQILGAYTSANNHESEIFSTEIVFGNSLILEYFEPKTVIGEGHFTIERVGSFYKDLIHHATKDFGDSESCEVNINCSEGNNWQDEKKGVARILVTSSAGQGWCTGSLINNTNADCHPYFLTAYHCGNNSSTTDMNAWIFYFNYEFSGCTGSSAPSSNSTTGATVVSRSNNLNTSTTSSDFMLLELSGTLPSNAYFNGWNISSVAPLSGVGIHHPAGDIKKISTFTSPPTTVGVVWSGSGYAVTAGTTHWSHSWAATSNGHGVTEGGSSGSPLFNSAGEIIGTLSGGGSFCTNTSASDQYGKMSYHWQSNATANNRRLKPWLDPTNSGVTSLVGTYAPCTITSTIDASLENFVSPSTDLCSFSFTPSVVLKNAGNVNLLTATISYQLNSGATQTTNWVGNLTPNSTETVTLNMMTTAVTANSISATVSNPNGVVDPTNGNNTTTKTFNADVQKDLPFLERFNDFQLDNDIRVVNGDNDSTWTFFNKGSFGTSNGSAFIDNWDYDAVGQLDWMITDAYDFSSSVDEELYFDIAYMYYKQTNGSNISYDSLGIAVSLDCGENWSWFWREGGIELATVDGGLGVEFVPENDDWEQKVISLSDLNGQSSVNFAFIAINGYGNNLYLDNIGIGKVLLSLDDDNTWANEVNIFPNPANNVLNLDLSSLEAENVNYGIYNSLGQKVYSANSSNQTETIDLSNFTRGVYYIKIESEGNQKMIKFIKD